MSSSRRDFLLTGLAATASFGGLDLSSLHLPDAPLPEGDDTPRVNTSDAALWYRRALRWGQTNIREVDPAEYDVGWWRQQWKRTMTQAVIINAGGIVAYYPTRFPLHHRALG